MVVVPWTTSHTTLLAGLTARQQADKMASRSADMSAKMQAVMTVCKHFTGQPATAGSQST
jgi:outer membrane murein-binding lipoprotein Lpp